MRSGRAADGVPGRRDFEAVPSNGRALLSQDDWQRVRKQLRLSPRESELVQHIFEGQKLSAIALAMRLSLGTVKTYSQRVRQKLQVTDQRELVLTIIGTHLRLTNGNSRPRRKSRTRGTVTPKP